MGNALPAAAGTERTNGAEYGGKVSNRSRPTKEDMDAEYPDRKHLKRIPVWIPDDQRVFCFVTVCCHERRNVFVADEGTRAAALKSNATMEIVEQATVE